MPLPMGISLKITIIQLNIKLVYYDVTVEYVNHYGMETSSSFKVYFLKPKSSAIEQKSFCVLSDLFI